MYIYIELEKGRERFILKKLDKRVGEGGNFITVKNQNLLYEDTAYQCGKHE